ncbi:MAG: tetratricopeptide repeat protein [Nitrospirales bacterium]|nr:tetratricopeptide repeat protein [Nitrospirales bacterium]
MWRIVGSWIIFVIFLLSQSQDAFAVKVEERISYRAGYTYENELLAGMESTVKYLAAAALSHPEDAELQYALGTVFWRYKPNQAQLFFKKAIEINPRHAKSYFLLGMLKIFEKDFQGFRGFIKKAIQADPYYVNAYNTLAMIDAKTGKMDEAIALMEQAKTRMTQEESFYFNQALMYVDKKQYEPAIKNLEQVITLNPDDREYHYLLGAAYKSQGRLADARRAMENVLRLDPGKILALLMIATTYKEENNFEKVFEYAERARTLAPENATVLAEIQEYEEAYEVWKKEQQE